MPLMRLVSFLQRRHLYTTSSSRIKEICYMEWNPAISRYCIWEAKWQHLFFRLQRPVAGDPPTRAGSERIAFGIGFLLPARKSLTLASDRLSRLPPEAFPQFFRWLWVSGRMMQFCTLGISENIQTPENIEITDDFILPSAIRLSKEISVYLNA